MIYILRHGQTAHNRAQLLQGRSDLPLNEEGRRQAAAVGAFFRASGVRFDAVYASPLRRAVETARLAAGEDVPVRTDARLIEMDYGPYEGMDLQDPAPELLAFFRDFAHAPTPPGMEPLACVVSRLGSFLEELRGEAAGRTVLLSTHAIAMKGALEYLTPASQGGYWAKYLANCAVYTTQLVNGRFTVPAELLPPGAGS